LPRPGHALENIVNRRAGESHLRFARQIQAAKLLTIAAGPRQFRAQKNLRDFEFGQLFSSNPRA
jgi:hypothetical protein